MAIPTIDPRGLTCAVLLLLADLPEIDPAVVLDELEVFAHQQILHEQAQPVEQLVVQEEALQLVVGPTPEFQRLLLLLLRTHSYYLQEQVFVCLAVGEQLVGELRGVFGGLGLGSRLLLQQERLRRLF